VSNAAVPVPTVAAGLDFPGSDAVSSTMRFRFLNPLPAYPATYIWRVYPRQQAGYYTTFFWGNDDGQGTLATFLSDGQGGANTFYGAHPYPQPPPNGTSHKWEIAVEQKDFLSSQNVVYNRWYTQALVVWNDGSGNQHKFYWDLDTGTNLVVSRTTPDYAIVDDPPVPALTFGDAPWQPGNEVYNGIISGIRVYSTNLSLSDIQSEAASPLSTAAGRANIWYLNMDPTPTDISDKSGSGHNPSWVGNARPALYSGSGSGSSNVAPGPPTNLRAD